MAEVLNIGELKSKFFNIFNGKKKLVLLVIGIVGLLMMMLSSLTDGNIKQPKSCDDRQFSISMYEEKLEKRLLDIVEKVNGVGKAKIMVTLENGVEYIYAQEKREKKDKIDDYQGKIPLKTQERNDEEKKLMVVDGPNGKKQALIKTELQPKVKGVVIVCQGGNNPLLNQHVINLITTVLNIPSTRVYVTKSLN